ncbi:S-adenosylmethionine:tRNA ribosyltransferase-isomerase [Actinacidiphila glaucinigra]|uniref:S-adenosylmethionine:tRNA ribosyltransferase-isomerase n=1 Tax=Actinacidiphila glaucinigra TaxID=235986 RepID=UPI0037B7C522
MTALGALRVPEELAARVPVEQRSGGASGRDGVRLLVGRRAGGEVAHHVFGDLPELLRAGDVLVVNTSRTLPAAVDATLGEAPVVVHFSGLLDDGRWVVELRTPDGRGTTRPRAGGPAGLAVALPGGERLVPQEPLSPCGERLWVARASVADAMAFLHRHGRPIRYAYTERDQPAAAYRTVFSVPESTAWLVNAARAGGGRVVAVGTTAVRALETAADARGRVAAAGGWTDLVVTPERGVRAVDGLLTGLHDPAASHVLMLEAVAGRQLLERVYDAAVRAGYLWHEFGDVNLLLP